MQVKLTTGQMAEITSEEAKRIQTILDSEMKDTHDLDDDEYEHNEKYHKRAWDNIVKAAESIGISWLKPTEMEMKEILAILFATDDICSDVKAELVWEMIEWCVSNHWNQIHNVHTAD